MASAIVQVAWYSGEKYVSVQIFIQRIIASGIILK
jgi:hypothetical protein